MHAKKGNMRRVKNTVSSNAPSPKSRTKAGAASMPAPQAMLTKNDSTVKKQAKNSRVLAASLSSSVDLKTGINATDIEPSAKSRRNKLGIIKATEKASESAPVPSRAALVISRTKPSTRDASVSNDSTEPCRSIEGGFFTGIGSKIQAAHRRLLGVFLF